MRKTGGAFDQYRKGVDDLLRRITEDAEAAEKPSFETGATAVENVELKN